jgi:serine/threonine-protein kinase
VLPNISPGKYKILEKVGDGATSTVFHAIQLRNQEHISLKVLKHYFNVEDEKVIELFQNEIQVLKSCEHPNIVRIYDFQMTEIPYFMVLEFIDGVNLSNIMGKNGKVFSISEAMQYLRPICSALDHLHKHGFVYCDFKPMNVMVGKRNRCVLIDFGSVSVTVVQSDAES